MSRTVFCKKYQKDLPGLERLPFPGPKGQEIFDNVSKQAWEEWQAHQTMLINERQLNMMDTGSRIFIQEEMQKFLAGEEYAKADGYIPPENDS